MIPPTLGLSRPRLKTLITPLADPRTGTDVIGFNDIFGPAEHLKLAVYAPVNSFSPAV